MSINSINLHNIFSIQRSNKTELPYREEKKLFPNLAPLKKDTISFKGKESETKKRNTQKVKKSDFKGIDFSVIEKFRINISGFKNTKDLQIWAKEKIKNDFLDKDFGGKQEQTKVLRKATLRQWFDYLSQNPDKFSPAEQLLIMDAITKNLKYNNDKMPPDLDKDLLIDIMNDLKEQLQTNPKSSFNLNKSYQLRQSSACLTDINTGETETKWVVIPGKNHDLKNFERNVEKLKILSHKNWCTKSFNVEQYLQKGDFHIFLEKGKPKIAIRCIGEDISEIQGELNNSVIPQKYFDVIKKHIKDCNLKLKAKSKKEMDKALTDEKTIKRIEKEIGKNSVKNLDYEKILPYFGINVEKDINGMLILSHYEQPKEKSFKDLQIDEQKLFEKVIRIKGDANFEGSQLQSTGKLQVIDGNASFWNSNIESLSKLKKIGKNASFQNSKITNLGKLLSIGGRADFSDSRIEDFGKLKHIGGTADFRYAPAYSTGNIEYIGKEANFSGSFIEDMGKLKHIGSNVYLEESRLTEYDFENIEVKGKIIN